MRCGKICDTKLGKILLIEENEKIVEVSIKQAENLRDVIFKETELLKKTEKQLQEYLARKRKVFDIPIQAKGTAFREKVWKELEKIPYGETRTYQEIAEKIGNPKACRAVGMANHHNPIPILIPCHRVIGKKGNLVGYALGLNLKEILLTLEQENKDKR